MGMKGEKGGMLFYLSPQNNQPKKTSNKNDKTQPTKKTTNSKYSKHQPNPQINKKANNPVADLTQYKIQ